MNPIKWFSLKVSVLNANTANPVNTTRVITSCNTFSCHRLNGPPLPVNPILLAGTWKQYSKRQYPNWSGLSKKAQFCRPFPFGKLKMSIPCQCHKYIRNDKQNDRVKWFHNKNKSKLNKNMLHSIMIFGNSINYFTFVPLFHEGSTV